ncbi:C-GCAxxG-C-C family protein [Draconibacterium halophilum]|uniref:C_GCAxxG_C_C family protein n=1 Tax=Draconibacterium halophilum TaxID=2706887 RepID=A0A6C0RCY2_9BACT|nr:C-GCAxxG-C-C family protein [Draconibacterium halophilum]QIA08498.1 C_GCAxxG_C_C family protein [Draconibacterium halophilum]
MCTTTNTTKEFIIEEALNRFDEGYACSQSVLLAFADHFKLDKTMAKRISSTFGGGMGRLRETCGAVTGGFMVMGLAFGNEDPKDMDTKLNSYKKVRELNKLVEDIHGTTNCRQLLIKHATEAQVKDRKHHKIICRKVVGDATTLVYDILKENNEI